MSKKSASSTITSTEVQELLRSAAHKLSAREEKTLRLRHGAGIAKDQPLPRRGQEHPEARAELAALEIELKRKLEERAASQGEPQPQVRSREKDKIIRALRRMK